MRGWLVLLLPLACIVGAAGHARVCVWWWRAFLALLAHAVGAAAIARVRKLALRCSRRSSRSVSVLIRACKYSRDSRCSWCPCALLVCCRCYRVCAHVCVWVARVACAARARCRRCRDCACTQAGPSLLTLLVAIDVHAAVRVHVCVRLTLLVVPVCTLACCWRYRVCARVCVSVLAVPALLAHAGGAARALCRY